MCASVTVLSIRTLRPVSTFPLPAVSINVRLIRSHTSARADPIDFWSADFFGGRSGSTRAKCCAEGESRSANSMFR